MNTLPLYQVILAYPPFDDWGEHRTLNIPLWRAVDQDKALLILVGKVAHIYRLLACMKGWGFAYHSASTRGADLLLVGRVGDITPPPLVGVKGLRKRLFPLGEPRLLLNPPQFRGFVSYEGWDTWSPFGWHQRDLYAYPVRKTHIAVEETVLDAAQDFRRIYEDGSEWRWRLGDAVMRLIDSRGLPPMEAYKWAHTAIGGQVSVAQIAAFTNLAEKVPPSQRDRSITWGDYYKLVIRSSKGQ